MSLPFHERRSPRLAAHDYSAPGAYFVTIVAYQRRFLFGDVTEGRSRLNDAGTMVRDTWNAIARHYASVVLDACVVMPNHLHGILLFEAPDVPTRRLTLPAVLQSFKALTTSRYIAGVNERGWPPFEQHLWQRSFHDRVIRNEKELSAFREYIVTNPIRWTLDREFPSAMT